MRGAHDHLSNFNSTTGTRAGWSAECEMPCVMFQPGVTYVRVKHGGTCEELDETQRQVIEWYVHVQDTASWIFHVTWGWRTLVVWAGYVKSIFKPPNMILTLPACQWAIVECVWCLLSYLLCWESSGGSGRREVKSLRWRAVVAQSDLIRC